MRAPMRCVLVAAAARHLRHPHSARVLSISPERLVISRGQFRKKLSAPWEDIASIEIHEREALIYTRDGGRRRLDLSDLENRSDVVAAMRDAQARLHAASS